MIADLEPPYVLIKPAVSEEKSYAVACLREILG
jgi:hypothetical protein